MLVSQKTGVGSPLTNTSSLEVCICWSGFRRICYLAYKPCPPGWTKINGRCFRYVAIPMTWANAEKNCLSMGANLASVHNAYEYRRVQALIRAATCSCREAWLGGSDAQQERTWLWSDGSPMRYTNWCRGEPNNYKGSQHCLQMNWTGKENIT
ncbi:PREDICTED: ladderlectin-like, partial [Poecilia mexicana]|uniref:ladderlectin-like n=1 Tax=Poecilia mexicana TaxID=48701 RepID=UPI00072EBD61